MDDKRTDKIFDSIKKNNFDSFLDLSDAIRDWNLKDRYGATMLHRAAKVSLDITKFLVKNGADVHATNGYGMTPLHIAATNDLAIVQYMVEQGGDVAAWDRFRNTPLHYAILNDNQGYAITKYLVGCGADVNVVERTCSTGIDNSPLHLAVWEDIDIVKYLVEHGADVNASNEIGETPLHLAAESDFEITKYLIINGADVNAKCCGGTVLFPAVCNDLVTTKYFVEQYGFDVNTRDGAGNTPLQYACDLTNDNEEYLEITKFLIEQGAQLEDQDNDGDTALHFAVQRNLSLAELLVEHGANVNARNNYGQTPLHKAILDIGVTKFLVEHGVDIRAKDEYNRAALDVAIEFGQWKAVRFLQETLGEFTFNNVCSDKEI